MEIVKTNITNQVFDYIQEKIATGEWKPGQKIPAETELAKQLNISRMSLRTGIQKANIMGITETRVGEGTFIKEFSMRPFLETLYKSKLVESSDEDINQIREILQIGSVRLAFLADDIDDDVIALEDTFNHMKEALHDNDIDSFHEYDAQFHRGICKLCHNEIMYAIYDSMEYILDEVTRLNVLDSIKYNSDTDIGLIEYHQCLLDAIKERDIDKFIDCVNAANQRHKRYKECKKKK